MGIKRYNPTTPSRRGMTVSTFDEITKKSPEKSLLAPLSKKGGRNSYGRITVRHIGGGNKTKYRIIDFKRNKDGMNATVIGIEYDPNRSANIALLEYEDKERRYILAPIGLKDGDTVRSGADADIKPGNALPIENIPVGTMVHNVEMKPGKGGQLVRSAGNAAQILAKEGAYAHLRLPSGEMRLIAVKCKATIGEVGGNADRQSQLSYTRESENKLNMIFTFDHVWCNNTYAAKNNINPSLVISDGCAEPNTGIFIHLVAPLMVLPKPGTNTSTKITTENK